MGSLKVAYFLLLHPFKLHGDTVSEFKLVSVYRGNQGSK